MYLGRAESLIDYWAEGLAGSGSSSESLTPRQLVSQFGGKIAPPGTRHG